MAFPHDGKKMKKGETLNPNGRPKGVRNLSTVLREMLLTEVTTIDQEGNKTVEEFQDTIIRKLLTEANKGNIQAIKEVFDRIEGKAKQDVKLSGTVETDNKHEVIFKKYANDKLGS